MIISGLQAKAKDRQWLKNQTSGELDDTKLIEGRKYEIDYGGKFNAFESKKCMFFILNQFYIGRYHR